jgi:hypothetical protein
MAIADLDHAPAASRRKPRVRCVALPATVAAHEAEMVALSACGDDAPLAALLTHCRALHAADIDSDAYATAALRICEAMDAIGGAS